MDTNLPVNRVESDINQWRSREERLGKLFPTGIANNRVLLREKLHYYDATAARYKDTNNQDERFALRILRQERKRIEKQLYPNVLLRLLRTLVIPVRQQYFIKQETKKENVNQQEIKEVLLKSGFGNLSNKLEQYMKQGQPEFTIPVSYYQNEKERVDFNLFFAKDQNGKYQLETFKAQLRSESKPEETMQQTFRIEPGSAFTANEAYNLLSGRAIQKEHTTIEGQRQNTWMQLDFNDKDATGNFRIKEFHAGHGYDLRQMLSQLPLKEASMDAKEKLMNNLINGSRQQVTFLKEGKDQTFYIEANPQHRTINIYDEHSKKISMASAHGNKTADTVQMVKKTNLHQNLGNSRKNGLSAS